ncbi:MAG: chromosomal replication initiation protein [Peptococcaceae bacterium BRH_c4b]|nr:MAG: chromosomal replication initiation protein [Peptococcaceae bacterium BRH_c4b]
MNKVEVSATWDKILSALEKKLNHHNAETWLQSMKPVDCVDSTFYIQVPDHFSRDWLSERYGPIIKNTIYDILKKDTEIVFILNEDVPSILSRINKQPLPPVEDLFFLQLNPKYSFDSFVVGESNRFAHAASMAVAESPAKTYNPFFIYGGVGLGKTHLMHAIAQHIINKNRSLKIAYVTSEKFTNDLINSIRDKKPEEFRNKYRNMDILLVDDIQFLAGKEMTQEEFFHTFNTLHEANKQIIISSDRPPKEIPTLEDRLRSRFEWGLITDIQPPDLETRIAILRKKVQLENLNVPDDVVYYIANRIQSNIRELEGALIRLAAYSMLNKCEINIEMSTDVLKDILPPKQTRQINIQLIHQIVSEYYNIRPDDFKSKKRTRNVSFPRQIAMYLTREMTDLSLPKIGEYFGGRDHTTVIHAYDRIVTEIQLDTNLQNNINEIINIIKS